MRPAVTEWWSVGWCCSGYLLWYSEPSRWMQTDTPDCLDPVKATPMIGQVGVMMDKMSDLVSGAVAFERLGRDQPLISAQMPIAATSTFFCDRHRDSLVTAIHESSAQMPANATFVLKHRGCASYANLNVCVTSSLPYQSSFLVNSRDC